MPTVFKLTQAEEKLAGLLWEKAPVASMDLIKIAETTLDWKKSTTFSVLKKLIEKGIAQNEKSVVVMLCTREQFVAGQSRRFIEDSFSGSLPKFFAAFVSGKTLTPEQAAELKQLIEDHEERT